MGEYVIALDFCRCPEDDVSLFRSVITIDEADDSLAEIDECEFYEENKSALQRRMEHMSDTFQEYLLYLIHEKNLSYTEVYKKALITKQVFSKIIIRKFQTLKHII